MKLKDILNEMAVPIKLKVGTVLLAKPYPVFKDPNWPGEYHISGIGNVSGKDLTIKNGVAVGMTPALAKRLNLETASDVQPETSLQKEKREAKYQAEVAEKLRVEHDAKFYARTIQIGKLIEKLPTSKHREVEDYINGIAKDKSLNSVERCDKIIDHLKTML